MGDIIKATLGATACNHVSLIGDIGVQKMTNTDDNNIVHAPGKGQYRTVCGDLMEKPVPQGVSWSDVTCPKCLLLKRPLPVPIWTVEIMLEGRSVIRHAFATKRNAEDYLCRLRDIEEKGSK